MSKSTRQKIIINSLLTPACRIRYRALEITLETTGFYLIFTPNFNSKSVLSEQSHTSTSWVSSEQYKNTWGTGKAMSTEIGKMTSLSILHGWNALQKSWGCQGPCPREAVTTVKCSGCARHPFGTKCLSSPARPRAVWCDMQVRCHVALPRPERSQGNCPIALNAKPSLLGLHLLRSRICI